MTPMRMLTIALLLAILAACSSAPASRFYVLTPGQVASPTSTAPSVGIGPVTVPEFLEREALIIDREDSRLRLASNHRWAEPVAEGIGRVMAINLAALLDTQAVQRFPWRRDQQPAYSIQLDVWQLEAGQGQARLIAQWSVQNTATDETLSRQISHLDTPLAATDDAAQGVPEAFSTLLYLLSRDIAAVVAKAEL